MLQGNNVALLGAQAVVDTSGLADQFRDGQKLRQEYEARQQTKALNELMGIQDFNERIAKARTHKYAGALVPELQKYEEARQKAALDNLGASADIGKTYGETSKLNAESGKIGAETTGLVRENTAGIQNDISALAVTQNPKLFALGIGEMVKQGLINPERADMMLKMVASDQPNAAAVLQSMVMANPELAKLFKPEVEYTNLGDRVESQVYDPLVGTVTGKGGYNIGQSPDNKATNATSRANNINTVDGQKYASDNTYDASVYSTDVRSADTRYNTNVTSEDRRLKLDQDGNIAGFNYKVAQQNADTKEYEVKNKQSVGANGQPVRQLAANERAKLFEIQEQQNADISVVQTLDKMMKLVDNSYSGVAASGRAKGLSNIGLGGERADNTVLYDNLATSQALAQLKATFGAAPTEGERKILMDIQASANKTPMQKKQIIAQAFRAVQARQAYREKLANGIRTGQYIVPVTQAEPKTTQKNQSKSAGQAIIGHILGGG